MCLFLCLFSQIGGGKIVDFEINSVFNEKLYSIVSSKIKAFGSKDEVRILNKMENEKKVILDKIENDKTSLLDKVRNENKILLEDIEDKKKVFLDEIENDKKILLENSNISKEKFDIYLILLEKLYSEFREKCNSLFCVSNSLVEKYNSSLDECTKSAAIDIKQLYDKSISVLFNLIQTNIRKELKLEKLNEE